MRVRKCVFVAAGGAVAAVAARRRIKGCSLHRLPNAVCECVQVEPFLLVPRRSGENERERRKELLRRRNEHIQLTGGPMGV